MSEKLIKPILEGLLGFRLFESKCGMSGVYSEYFYYPAFYKIVFHRSNLKIFNEHYIKCDKSIKSKGRPNSIDFVLMNIESKTYNSAFEIKVKTSKRVNCAEDVKKLICFLTKNKNTKAYIIIFSSEILSKIQLADKNKDFLYKKMLLADSPKNNECKYYMKFLERVYYPASNRTYLVTAFRVTINKNK